MNLSLNDLATGAADTRKFLRSEIDLIRTKLHIADLYYYHIYAGGSRRGYVEIRKIDNNQYETVKKSHFSIAIHINSLDRGRGIGTHSYFLACQQSGLKEVYAHMTKANIASKIAAERAGFKVIDDKIQLTLMWKNKC